MDFNWISAGELQKGQFVTMIGLRPVKKEVLLPTGEFRTLTEEDKSPWIKGIPFQVLNVKLPLVMLHNVCRVPNIPPAVFYDTRLVEFIEVDEEYAASYAAVMFPQNVQVVTLPADALAGLELPNSPEESEGQGTFKFGEDEGESGGPPLVPK